MAKECKIIHINDGNPRKLENGNFHFAEEFPWAETCLTKYIQQGYTVKQMFPDFTPVRQNPNAYCFYKSGFIVYLERNT